MVPRVSFVAGVAIAASSLVAANPFPQGGNNFGSFSDLTASASTFGLSSTSSSSSSSSSAATAAGSSQITAAPSSGFTSAAAQNATSYITAKPQTTLSLFNACSGSGSSCESLTYWGSVVSVDQTKTIVALECSQQGKNGTQDCFTKAITVTQAPSMFARVDDSGATPTTLSCSISGKTASAHCAESYAATGSQTASAAFATNSANSTVSGNTYDFGASEIHYNTLIITSGSEKLANGTVASKTPSAPASMS